jgi:uncharacterized membrane protein AbrB (regulator of aidB expression)
VVTVGLPPFVTIAAQIVIGTSIGTQFAQLRGRHVPRTVITSMGTTIVMLAGALIVAELMAPSWEWIHCRFCWRWYREALWRWA